jgi:hypothetical protein
MTAARSARSGFSPARAGEKDRTMPHHKAKAGASLDVDAILHRVRALLAKTVANGATEAEAEAATAKARR